MSIRADEIEEHGPGPAFWRAVATTEQGRYLVKLPLLDPTSGHDGPWKEYIALSVARQAGLPFLEPQAIHVGKASIPAGAAPIYWGDGEIFCGTPFLDLTPTSELAPRVRALLFGIDNVLHYGDRAQPGAERNDYWLGPDGLVLLDLDMVALPTRPDDMVRSDSFAWFGRFLVRGLGLAVVRDAFASIRASLPDDFLEATVARASSEWRRVNASATLGWLRARRDALETATVRAEQDRNNAPPWFQG